MTKSIALMFALLLIPATTFGQNDVSENAATAVASQDETDSTPPPKPEADPAASGQEITEAQPGQLSDGQVVEGQMMSGQAVGMGCVNCGQNAQMGMPVQSMGCNSCGNSYGTPVNMGYSNMSYGVSSGCGGGCGTSYAQPVSYSSGCNSGCNSGCGNSYVQPMTYQSSGCGGGCGQSTPVYSGYSQMDSGYSQPVYSQGVSSGCGCSGASTGMPVQSYVGNSVNYGVQQVSYDQGMNYNQGMSYNQGYVQPVSYNQVQSYGGQSYGVQPAAMTVGAGCTNCGN